MSAATSWKPYIESPPAAAGVYEWRVPSVAVPGLVVTFAANMRMRGAGFRDVLSPSFDTWDGYRVLVPGGTEWRECEPMELRPHAVARLGVEGLQFVACPYCGNVPSLHGLIRSSGGVSMSSDPHRFNSWWLECCPWGNTPELHDPREIECIRRDAYARAGARRPQSLPDEKVRAIHFEWFTSTGGADTLLGFARVIERACAERWGVTLASPASTVGAAEPFDAATRAQIGKQQ